MNTANLQMRGVLLAAAAVFEAIERKRILPRQEMLDALKEAEDALLRDHGQLTRAQAESCTFPIRFLRQALTEGTHGLSYTRIAAAVGEAAEQHRQEN